MVSQFPGRLELKEVQWRPQEGWIAHEIVWYSPRDLTRPLFTASKINVKKSLGAGPLHLRIFKGSLSTNIGVWTRDLATRYPLEITDISGGIVWESDEVRLEQFQGMLAGIILSVDGGLTMHSEESEGESETLDKTIGRMLRPLVPVLKGLETLTSEPPVELSFHVSGEGPNPTIGFDVTHPYPFELRGAAFAEANLEGKLEDRILSLGNLKITGAQHKTLEVASEVDFRNQRFDLMVTNTLGRRELEALSPFSLDGFLSTFDLRVEGQPTFTLKVGPASFQTPAQQVTGSFQLTEAFYKDAFFQTATFDLDLKGSRLRLPQFSGTVGEDGTSGEITGDLELDFDSGLFGLSLEGNADPDQAVSLVGPQVEAILREWEFKGRPPEIRLEAGKENRETPMQVRLIAKAENAVWRGTLFDQIRAVTSLDEEGLRIRELLATRGPHLLEGSLSFPRSLETCTLTLDSSFPIPDVVPLLGPQAMNMIQPIRFQGTTEFSASGIVDLSGKHQHRISGTTRLEDVVFRWMMFDTLTTSFVVEGQQIELPDIEANIVEGALSGEVQFQKAFLPTGSFRTDLKVKNVDLFELITKATDRPTTPYTGTLNLELELAGALHDSLEANRFSTFQGQGAVSIRDGQLFRIPLLLGLSNILSKVVRGFGYASQGDFDADFVIRNGRVSAKELFLGGSLLSIAGSGAYDLVSREIDGNLKIQLLKDGLMSDALKVLLWPIRKLIEVQLTGTLDDPDWRPRNLPKELFGK